MSAFTAGTTGATGSSIPAAAASVCGIDVADQIAHPDGQVQRSGGIPAVHPT
jgi:hypothetical protein